MRNIVLVAAAAAMVSACTQVKPGHVGVMVDNFGSNAGVENQTKGVGYYFTGLGQQIFEYPVYTQTYSWTANTHESSGANEEFTFQDAQGLSMAADVGISFSVDPTKASILFQKYRTNMDGIIAGPVRNEVRDSLTQLSSTYPVDQIAGPKKAELIAKAEARTRTFFAPFGLNVERLYWASNIRLPDQVRGQIEQKIANEQGALAAEAQVATVKAQAQQRVAQAQGEAEALSVQGSALRANPEVLRLKAIEKWDGKLPQVTSGATPFLNLNEATK
jgi:regulator of protease activity HflC (stomatin/prohibitin superfamily)